jgi:Alpha/beta hydrolase domain
LGGIRTPQVEAPLATLSGLGQPGSAAPGQPRSSSSLSAGTLCGIFGTTVPFSASKLKALYPTHATFTKKWDAATASLVRQGYLLPADARTLDTVAAQSDVGTG